MNKFLVINVKHLIFALGMAILLVCVSVFGNSLVEQVIETASTNRLLPIYSVEKVDKCVAITFDCAWGADDISDIVSTLTNNGVYATFFTVGDWVKKHPDAVNILSEAEMEIRKSF